MFIYVGRTFSATLRGTVIKRVECERCKAEFFYELTRSAIGQASSPYYINQSGAAKRAEKAAQKRLNKQLDQDIEPVPCPQCHWVQEAMVEGYRRSRLRWVVTLAWVCIILGALMVLMGGLMFHNDPLDPERGGLVVAVVGLAGALSFGFGLLAVRRLITGRIDLNRDYPRPTPAVPGVPPPLVAQGPAVNGDQPVLAPAHPRDPHLPDGSITWRLAHDQVAPFCCSCMGQPERPAKLPAGGDQVLGLPVCQPCWRRIIGRWWMWALGCLAVSLTVAAGAALLLFSGDEGAMVALFIAVSAILGIASIILIPARQVMPYRFRMIDRRRLVAGLSFRNPQYAQAMLQSIESYGRPSPPPFEAIPNAIGFPVVHLDRGALPPPLPQS